MKIIMFLLIIIVTSCSNPYIDPDTSRALSQEAQLEEMKLQTHQLKRIADALEQKQYNKHKYDSSFIYPVPDLDYKTLK